VGGVGMTFELHALGKTHSHCAFLGVTEGYISVGGMQCDLEIEDASFAENPKCSVIRTNDLAVRANPIIAGFDHADAGSRFDFFEGLVDGLAAAGFLGPKIDSVDIPMSEPEGPMMWMIVIFTGRVLQRPVSGHGQTAPTDQRIIIWPGDILKKVFGEELSVDLDPQSVGQFSNLDACFHWLVGSRTGQRERKKRDR
jgi:hypothetical protein